MAIVKCKECVKDISSDAQTCPHCGKVWPVAKPEKVHFLRAVAIAIACTFFLVLVVIYSGEHSSQRAELKPVLAQESSPATAPAIDNSPALTPRETGQVFSEYIGQLQAKLLAAGLLGDVYGSKLKQDAKFNNLEAMRTDSETLKTMLMNEQDELSKILAPPGNYSDVDGVLFGEVYEAAQALLGDDIEMAVDVAVAANYGMQDDGDMDKITREMKQTRKKYEALIFEGYKRFGYKRSDVNSSTLTLKPDAADPAAAPGKANL